MGWAAAPAQRRLWRRSRSSGASYTSILVDGRTERKVGGPPAPMRGSFRYGDIDLAPDGAVEVHFAADDGVHDAGRENLIFGNGHDVFRQDRDVGQLAGFERTFQLLFERRVGIVPGVRLERLLAR